MFGWLVQAALAAPGGVNTNVQIWYRADQVTASGSDVTAWLDQSGNGRDATNATGSDEPEWIAANAEIAGQPSIRFTQDFLDFDGSWVAGSDYTVFVVGGRLSSPPANFYVGGSSSTSESNLIFGYQDDTTLRLSQFGNDLDANVPGKGGGREWNLDVGQLDQSTGHSIWRNGPLEASNGNTTPLVGWTGASVGRFEAFTYWFDGDIAEIVMYDRALSCTERITVEAALAAQYGLAWATDDDADSDGVCDDADACPGSDDAVDDDADGIPDGCDACFGDNATGDGDSDGVCDDLDACEGDDATGDGDTDGVCDDLDTCPGSDDTIDTDADGVADGCDTCPGYPDAADTDADGVPDGCDTCPGGDDGVDVDGDGVPDDCDVCLGYDDGLDTDGDGIPNGCDSCALLDYDGDGVPSDCDLCPGYDDTVDTDADGTADGCDPCPALAGEVDADLDGAFSCDDCDEADDTVFPGATEGVADGLDQDCDGQELCYVDDDDDGYGTSSTVSVPGVDCVTATGAADNDLDCDDANPAVNPGATEIDGNGLDDDCDGLGGTPGDTGSTSSGRDWLTSGEDAEEVSAGCACSSQRGTASAIWFALLGVLATRRRGLR